MNANLKSAGELAVISSTAETRSGISLVPVPSRPSRDGSIAVGALIDVYMARNTWAATRRGHSGLHSGLARSALFALAISPTT